MSYHAYTTPLATAEQLGVLPHPMRQTIPASTLYNFRRRDFSRLVGLSSDITEDLSEVMSLVKTFAHSPRAHAVFRAALRVKHVMVSVLGVGRSIASTLARHKQRVVSLLQDVTPILGERRVLHWLGITKTRFTRWKNQIVRRCPVSLDSLCLRTHPQQLASREIKTIKRLMTDPRFTGWPVASVYWRALRDQHIACALSTFYKYVNHLDLSPTRPASRRKDHSTGIRASLPNELWHADVTVFTTLDRVKSFIYFVVDNYSRRILAWAVDHRVCAATHVRTVRDAYHQFINPEDTIDTIVMTDGGPENVSDGGVPLRRLIAGQDVHFSNSLVESVNKIVKYQSLYLTDIPDRDALVRHLARFVPIYNDQRPHYAHKGLTPTEVHQGAVVRPHQFTDHVPAAKRARIEANRREPCPICTPNRGR